MIRKFHTFLLILLPLLFLITCLFCRSSKGDYFLINRYDPSYAYLMNSLNLSQFDDSGVGHYDHPGTTVQEIGALTINILYFFSDNSSDKISDVFKRSEYYLSAINLVFILMNSAALFITGFIFYKKSGGFYQALMLQLTPLFSLTVFFWIINVSPEPLLIFTLLMLISLCICYVFETALSLKKNIFYVCGFALICGFGLASKISVLPVLVIPLLLIRGISFKLLFCLFTIFLFGIFVMPALTSESLNNFFLFNKNLLTHTGKYGLGEPSIIDFSSFKKNLKTIYSKDIVFTLSYILISITFFITLIPTYFKKIKNFKFYFLFTGVFISMTIQIIIVAKHFEIHYLIPAFMLTVFGLLLSDFIITELFPGKFRIKKFRLIFLIIIIFSFIQIKDLIKSINYFSYRRDISEKYIEYRNTNYPDWLCVSSYGASNRQFALFFGSLYSGIPKENYYHKLNDMYPDNYYYNKWLRKIELTEDINSVKNNLMREGKFIFLCDNEGFIKEFDKVLKEFTGLNDVTYKKVYSGFGDETIFEIYLKPEL